MKLWAIEEYEDYEGGHTLGYYTDEAMAREEFAKIKADFVIKYKQFEGDSDWDVESDEHIHAGCWGVTISEVEVNKPAKWYYERED